MKNSFLLLLLLVISMTGYAQEKRITGKVVDATDGEPIIGVTVVASAPVGNTSQKPAGSITNVDGVYSIQVPDGFTSLSFSFVGMENQTVKISGRTQINVTMNSTSELLDEVVITALGIKREVKALSYSTQGVNMDNINDAKSGNIVSSLSGKIAGVQITPPGLNNGSARIVIRGNNSVTGNNQPLFVVDGMPIETIDGEKGNLDYGNGFSDINPDDIEKIDVLKGANAAALYGSRAANGVILITTKKGDNKFRVNVNSNCMFQTLTEFPEYQNSYGVGTSSYIDNKNNPPSASSNYRSWGSPMMGQLFVGLDGNLREYLPEADNVKDFYQTAETWTNSVSAEGGGGKSQFRFSYTNSYSSSVVEKVNIDKKSTFNLRLNNQFTDRISLDSKITYVHDKVKNRQYSKSDSKNPMNSYVHMARSTSLSELKEWKDSDGNEIGTHRNFSNPYWIINENKNEDIKKRLTGSFDLKIIILKDLTLQMKLGMDTYNWNGYTFNNKGSVNDPDGQMQTFERELENFDIQGLLTYAKGWNKFSFTANAGIIKYSSDQSQYTQQINSLLQPGLINISNSSEYPVNSQSTSKKRINSIFGAVSAGYNNYLYLDITGRNDWSSTLPSQNNSYFYPSIGYSFVFSEAFKLNKPIISFGKIRGSYAIVGSDTNPYRVWDTYSFDGIFNDVTLASLSTTMNNPDLKPEKTYSWEVGADIRLLNNRLGFDFTYYNTTTKNQIINAQLPTSSGYKKRYYNAGEIRNNGIELMVHGTPLKTKDFKWDINVNWSKNHSKVISLINGVDRFQIGNYSSYLYVYAEVGKPYGYIRGLGVQRHEDGKMLMEEGGGLLVKDNDKEFGAATPDWVGGIANTLKYKSFDLSFLFDFKKGGIVYSASMSKMYTNGMTAETLFGRDDYYIHRIIWGESDNELSGGAWFDAVYADGSPANKYMSPQSYAYCKPNYAEFFIYDASYIKLREVVLGYTVNREITKKLNLEKLRIALVGRNLWTVHSNTPRGFDPEASQTSGNGQGIENGALPPSAFYGFDIKLTF